MDFPKEIQIQPLIHQSIQPVVTREIQPIIKEEIQPVVHRVIEPIIFQEIQPVITQEIQPIIRKEIQPVIFMENQTNIEEIIKQLEQSHKETDKNIFITHQKQTKVAPLTERVVMNSTRIKVIPYIMKDVLPQTVKKVEEKTETIIQDIKIVEYVPYIKYNNGKILPYEKKENKSIKTSHQIMDSIIAFNFISLNYNINYPMACKKTDIFSNIEKKLYHEFPILKSKQIYFVANGNAIDRSLTFEQNKIKSGNTILINEIEK